METMHKTFRCRSIVLNGPATYESLYTAECTTSIRVIMVIYDEASSADAGVEVRLGKIGSASYFATYITEVSKSAGAVVNLSQTSLTLAPGETFTVECDGNKTGAGTISIQAEVNYNITL